MHGINKSWHSNGKLCNIQCYFEGKKDGIQKGWDTTGFLTVFKKYSKGKPIGEHKQYYVKDKPKRFTKYNNKGQKHGWEVFWYDNGNVKDSTFYSNDSAFYGKPFYYNGKLSVHNIEIWPSYNIVSYDPEGNKTGEIKDGNGSIFTCDSLGKNCKELKYKDGKHVFK